MPMQSETVLEWRNVFPLPKKGSVPIVARHTRRHAECNAHGHDFMELVLISGGTGLHQSAAGPRRLCKGDVIVLRPGGWHGYVNCRDLAIYNLAFGADILHRELAWALEDPALSHLLVSAPLARKNRGVLHLHLHVRDAELCEQHLDELCALGLHDRGEAQRARRVGLHLLILGDVLAGADIRPGPIPRKNGLHPAVARGMFLFENDLTKSWGLAALAGQLGLERSYLIRLFKGGTGLPPMAYLARRRAERAAFLLIHSSAHVSEIAAEVGWTDPVYFARRFKAHFGLTASAYRARFSGLSE